LSTYLFTARRRIMLPHRLVEALMPFVRELADLLDAIHETTQDDRWKEASAKLADALESMRAHSAFYKHLIAVEQKQELEQPAPKEQPAEPRRPPRKGMIRASLPLIAALRRRRR
jgi:hypothetical protein